MRALPVSVAAAVRRACAGPPWEGSLAPGCAPIELSFSERQAARLRWVLEPGGPEATPAARWRASVALARAVSIGAGEVAQVDPPQGIVGFGAYLGVVQGPAGLEGCRLYEELPAAPVSAAGAALLKQAQAVIPGAAPLFVSRDWRRPGEAPAERVYLLCAAGLDLLALDRLMGQLGLGAQAAPLVRALLPLVDRPFGASAGRAVLGLRARGAGPPALKVDVLFDATLTSGAQFSAQAAALSAGPASAAWARWRAAVCGSGAAGALGVAAVAGAPLSRAVYWRSPAWFGAPIEAAAGTPPTP